MHRLNLSLLLIALFAVVLYLLFALPFQLHIIYKGKGKRHSLLLRFQTFNGYIGFNTKFAVGRQEAEVGLVKRTGLKLLSRLKREFHRSQLRTLNEVRYHYLSLKKLISYLRVFMRHCICKRFVWSTTVGFNDYAATGMATGLLWIFEGYVVGCISRRLRVLPPGPIFRVIPKFGKADFEISLDCILETRLGHIMIQLMKFLFWWLRISLKSIGGGKIGRPSDRNTYENGHGKH